MLFLGICPDPIGRYDNTYLDGGTLQSGTFTSMKCKFACLADDLCLLADYNMKTNECYFHFTINPDDLVDDTCCVQFVKTNCK